MELGAVLPMTAEVRDDHLFVGGVDMVELAHKEGTALYVMDEADMRNRMETYLKAFRSRYENSDVIFASKAFLNKETARIVAQEGLCLDVSGGGELWCAQQAGFPMERVFVHGNNKTPQELREAIQANAVMCKTAEAYVQDHMLELSEHTPAMVVGNGPNYGVAEEAALKLSETIKIPAMHHEGEEFVHGPEMQIVPGYLVFIVDDPQGSERLANIADALSNVTTKTVLLTAHPKGGAHEVAVPQVAPLLSAIPNLVFFQTIAAMIAERLKSWGVHPYLDAVSKQMEVKAEGYEESVNALKAKAAECYGM